jgi:hypothetical protein
MSDDSNEWDESTAEDRVDREDTETIIDVLKRRGYTVICRNIPEVERLAKVALLRELAAELDDPKEHLHCVANAKDTPQEFRRYLAKSLGERAEFMEADALEKGTPP